MSEQKSAPTMFAGITPPPAQPKPADTAKATNTPVSSAKPKGAPVGKFGLAAAIPLAGLAVLIVGATLGPIAAVVAAVVAAVALLAIGAIALLSRASARRVATTTKTNPDGTVTTTTRPIRKPGWTRQRNQRLRPPRTRDSAPGGRGRWPSRGRDRSPGGPSGGGNPRTTGRPGGKQPRNPDRTDGAKRRLRERVPGSPWRNRDRSKNPGGMPEGGPDRPKKDRPGRQPRDKAPGRMKPPKDSKSTDRPGRFKRAARSIGDTLARSHRANLPPSSPKPPRSPKSDKPGKGGNGQAPGAPGRTKRRRADNQAASPNEHGGKGRPSKVPTWVKRVFVPADPPPPSGTKDWSRRAKDKVRSKWAAAWSDGDSKSSAGPRPNGDPKPGGATPSTPTSKPESRASLTRRWRRRFRPELTDFKTKLDQRWEARAIGQKPAPKQDPVVRPKPHVSSAESAAFAEDWSPAPRQHETSRQSAEAGLMAEGDWKPEPRRTAPRSASQGGVGQMSNEGGIPQGTDASTTASRSAAYNGAANAAARVSAAKGQVANALSSQANAVSNREGMEAQTSHLRSEAGKARQDSAVMGAVAGKFREWGSRAADVIYRG